VRKHLEEQRRHAAWFGGDADELGRAHGSDGAQPVDRVDANRRSIGQSIRNFFWGRQGAKDPLNVGSFLKLHVPLAGDIASTSANLLFGEPPTFEIDDDAPEDDGSDAPETASDAIAAQDRLNELIEVAGVQNTLVEMAEWSAALGGAYLRPAWDRELADYPMLTVVQADRAVPEFRFGILTAVTFWTELETNDSRTVRHLERHEKGVILHGLYESSNPEALGQKIPLTAHPATQDLADSLTDGDEIRVEGFDESKGLFVRYIPNVLPNRRLQGYQGRSDFQGIESIMDALDETYTSWMRDIRLGKARILVERQYLDSVPGDSASGHWFNIDREAFTPMDMGPQHADAKATDGIKEIQFEIRTEAHFNTCNALREEAISDAGYSPQTFRANFEGTAESGTARRMRERKSLSTTAKKERYIRQPVSEMLEILLFLDKAVWERSTPVLRPRMAFSDATGEGPQEIAEAVGVLRTARTISIQTGVEMVHPDWSEEQVLEETARILDEEKLDRPASLLPNEELD
jgi:A118 family predicted phage portal protein